MKMFKSKRDKIREFLKDKDWMTLEEVSLGADLGKTSTKKTLEGLKGKEIEFKDDKYKLISPLGLSPETVADSTPNISEPQQGQGQMPEDGLNLPEQEPELQKKGLNAKMSEIEQKLDIVLGVKKKKEKKGKLKKFNKWKLKRFNKGKNRSVILMRVDRSIKLIKAEYIEGNIALLKIGENYYKGSAEYVWLWEQKQQVYVIPEWSLEPLSVDFINSKVDANKSSIESQIINLRAVKLLQLELEEGDSKKKPNFLLWIGIGLAGCVIAWLLWGGKK